MKKYLLVVAIIILFLIGCENKIKIGYSSGTTGQLSQVGVDGRNAFLLKIKEVNEAGGIDGKLIETLVLNDENDPNLVSVVHDEFEKKGYNLILGHIISSLDEAVLIEAKKNKLILSASMSSANMDGIDDNFIRLSSSYYGQVKHIAEYMYNQGVRNLSVVYDMRNSAYSEGFLMMLKDEFKGNIISEHPFGLDENQTEKDVVLDLEQYASDAVLMITPSNVTGRLCQIINLESLALDLYGVSWAMAPELIEIGGHTVEGLKIIYTNNDEKYQDEYESFRLRFIKEYNYEPSSICFNTYEATSILIKAIRETGSTSVNKLREYILNNTFSGLYTDIVIDEYGDRHQTFIMFEVINKEFVPVE